MTSKTYTIFRNLILLFFLSTLSISCCDNETYNVSISDLETRPIIFDGINPVAINEQTPINKEDLVIELFFSEMQELAQTKNDKENKTKVKVLEAAVVPCGDYEYNFINKIESITVVVVDQDNDETIDITNQLVVVGTDELISVFIPQNSPGRQDFLVQLLDTSNIPNQIVYIIEATLDDGSIISSTGGIINFN